MIHPIKKIHDDEFRECARLHSLWFENDPNGRRMDLSDATLAGVVLKDARLMRARLVRVDLSGADLERTILDGAELEDVSFERARLRGVDFEGATVVRGTFNEADLRDGTLANSRVLGTSFRGGNLAGANLAKSTFDHPSMKGAELANCHAVRWEVSNGDLRECNLEGTRLHRCLFERCDLRHANVANANLYRALIRHAKVYGLHGLPFLAEAFGGDLDFGSEGTGAKPGTMEDLRVQLGGGPGPGSGRYGLGATPSLYRAYAVHEADRRTYVIERVSDREEVIRVVGISLGDEYPLVDFEVLDDRFEDWLAVDLVQEVLLGGFMKHELRDQAPCLDFRNVTTDARHLREYGVPELPARPRQVRP